MTVEEYLRFACELKGRAYYKNEWAQGIVSDLKIENHLQVLIRNLSKGYKHRAAIAAAIAGEPDLLLLDEPVSGLDPRQASEFRAMLARIGKNMAVIISSHSLYEVAAICSRFIIMNESKIVADKAMAELASADTPHSARDNLEKLFIELTGE
jgi:ABC-2 type transport system ATP-binding protein